MIKVKNLFDAVEDDDGQRLWIEATNLTIDLREWCRVDHILCHLGPSERLSEWLEEHPDDYDRFRGVYHEALSRSPFLKLLKRVASAAQSENFTLLHQSNDPVHNTGVALHEFLSELQAYAPPSE